jgi:hypothetical protein
VRPAERAGGFLAARSGRRAARLLARLARLAERAERRAAAGVGGGAAAATKTLAEVDAIVIVGKAAYKYCMERRRAECQLTEGELSRQLLWQGGLAGGWLWKNYVLMCCGQRSILSYYIISTDIARRCVT